jgi:hypothetical protein
MDDVEASLCVDQTNRVLPLREVTMPVDTTPSGAEESTSEELPRHKEPVEELPTQHEEPPVDAVDTSRSSDEEQINKELSHKEGKSLIDDEALPLSYKEPTDQQLIENNGLGDGHPLQV